MQLHRHCTTLYQNYTQQPATVMDVIAKDGMLVVRYATLDDYEAVLAINKNIYEGLDYVPAMYKSFIADPNAMAFVLEINNIVVSVSIDRL